MLCVSPFIFSSLPSQIDQWWRNLEFAFDSWLALRAFKGSMWLIISKKRWLACTGFLLADRAPRKQKGNMQFIALRDQQKLAPNVSVLTDARKGINASVGQNLLWRQRGRVVSASDSQSGGPGFESRSGHLLDLCSVVPSSNSRPRL